MSIPNPWAVDECLNRIADSGSVKTNCASNSAPTTGASDKTTCHYVIEFMCNHYSNWLWNFDGDLINPNGELIATPCLILKKSCVQGEKWDSRWKLSPSDSPILVPNPLVANPCNQLIGLNAAYSGSDPAAALAVATNNAAAAFGYCHWIPNGTADPYAIIGGDGASADPLNTTGDCGASSARALSTGLAKWWLDLNDPEYSLALRFCSRYGGMSAIYTAAAFNPANRNLFNLYGKSDGLHLPNCLWVRPAILLPSYYGGPYSVTLPPTCDSPTPIPQPADGSNCQPNSCPPDEYADQLDVEECELGIDFAGGIPLTVQVCDTEFVSAGNVGEYPPGGYGLCTFLTSFPPPPTMYSCNWIAYTFLLSTEYYSDGTTVRAERYLSLYVYYNGGWKYDAYIQYKYVLETSACYYETLSTGTALSGATQTCSGVLFDAVSVDVDPYLCDDVTGDVDPPGPCAPCPDCVTTTLSGFSATTRCNSLNTTFTLPINESCSEYRYEFTVGFRTYHITLSYNTGAGKWVAEIYSLDNTTGDVTTWTYELSAEKLCDTWPKTLTQVSAVGSTPPFCAASPGTITFNSSSC